MKLLLTGASGFLGSNIKSCLRESYDITTVGLTDNDDYNVDLSCNIPDIKEQFDVILHAAGKAHSVPNDEHEKELFFQVNYQGTVNLCKALEKSGIPKAFVFISTVAVYGVEVGDNITEEYPLKGDTPYAASKKQAEDFLQQWCRQNQVVLTILRPCLLAGPTPPGNLGNMIAGIRSGKYLSIAGGEARKSILMVEDIANLITLTVKKGGIYNVCDNQNPTFRQLEILISSQMGKQLPFSIPYWCAKCLALVGDLLGNKAPINSLKLNKITQSLTFSSEKAQRELGWKPLDVLTYFKIE